MHASGSTAASSVRDATIPRRILACQRQASHWLHGFPCAQKLMMSMQIKVTPTFCLYRGMDVVRMVTGINEDNLRAAVKEELQGQQGERQERPLAPSQ